MIEMIEIINWELEYKNPARHQLMTFSISIGGQIDFHDFRLYREGGDVYRVAYPRFQGGGKSLVMRRNILEYITSLAARKYIECTTGIAADKPYDEYWMDEACPVDGDPKQEFDLMARAWRTTPLPSWRKPA